MISGSKVFSVGLLFAAWSFLFASCQTIDLYEKAEAVPGHQWQSSFKPQFSFTIKDTTAPYQVYFIIRHNNKYRYNNIWVNLHATAPADTTQTFRLELPLANNQGWLGSGMDDVFEHRIPVEGEFKNNFRFAKAGTYAFALEQIMRDDPLPEVMNVGIRVEKKTP